MIQQLKDLYAVYVIQERTCKSACTYCFKDSSENLTIDKLEDVWDWFKKVNNKEKTFGFIGFNPIQNNILPFLGNIKEDLLDPNLSVSVDINGCDFGNDELIVSLPDNFIDEYFSYPNTKMSIKIDKQTSGFNEIVFKILKLTNNFTAKMIVRPNNHLFVESFCNSMVRAGVKHIYLHVEVLGIDRIVSWSPTDWSTLEKVIYKISESLPEDVRFELEDVGNKEQTNCFAGKHELYVDATGDYYGCYAFANGNMPEHNLKLGNVLTDEYRAETFTKYNTMFEESLLEGACKTCDYSGYCYRCPTGMIANNRPIYAPITDDNNPICQQLVCMSLEMSRRVSVSRWTKKLMRYLADQSLDLNNAWKGLENLWATKTNNEISNLDQYEEIIDYMYKTETDIDGHASSKELYEVISTKYNIKQINPNIPDINQEVFYLAMLEFVLDLFNINC